MEFNVLHMCSDGLAENMFLAFNDHRGNTIFDKKYLKKKTEKKKNLHFFSQAEEDKI